MIDSMGEHKIMDGGSDEQQRNLRFSSVYYNREKIVTQTIIKRTETVEETASLALMKVEPGIEPGTLQNGPWKAPTQLQNPALQAEFAGQSSAASQTAWSGCARTAVKFPPKDGKRTKLVTFRLLAMKGMT